MSETTDAAAKGVLAGLSGCAAMIVLAFIVLGGGCVACQSYFDTVLTEVEEQQRHERALELERLKQRRESQAQD